MCRCLVEKGNLAKPLILYNRTISRATELNARIGHSIVADTIYQAVTTADIIFSCLEGETAVNETFGKILSEEIEGKLFVECSTTPREQTNELAKKVEAAQAHFIAMPGRLDTRKF